MAARFLFLGIGNPHRGDDAAGPRLAERLRENKTLKSLHVDIVDHGGEGVSLMDLWEGAQKTVIVDAMKSGAAVGTVKRFDANVDRLGGGTFHYSSHLFSLAEAVELARQLNRLPQELVVYGIEGRAFEFGAPLSPEVEAALAEVEVRIEREFADA